MQQNYSPSVSTIQAVLGPTGIVTKKTGEETGYTYVGGSVEDYVPKVRDIISTVDYGNDHFVRKVLSVWTEEGKELITFAITNRVNDRIIIVNDVSVQLISAVNRLALQLSVANVGMSVIGDRTGKLFLVANVGGGKVLDFETCKTKHQEQQRIERQKVYAQKVDDRRNRLQTDLWQLERFSELEVYRKALEEEWKLQAYFDEQELRHIDRLELEIEQANKAETINLTSMRQAWKHLNSRYDAYYAEAINWERNPSTITVTKAVEELLALRRHHGSNIPKDLLVPRASHLRQQCLANLDQAISNDTSKVSHTNQSKEQSNAAAAGALAGGIIGMFAGPFGAVVGAAIGGALGASAGSEVRPSTDTSSQLNKSSSTEREKWTRVLTEVENFIHNL